MHTLLRTRVGVCLDAGKTPGTPAANAVTVNPATVYQRIDGFGASTAWGSSFTNASDPETLWSTTTGAGLSLHRIHIDDADDSTSELSVAQKAVSYGVKGLGDAVDAACGGQVQPVILRM
jgi:O-glycosyl hydrolase